MIKKGELSFGWLPWTFAVCFDSGSPVLPESVDGFVCRVPIGIYVFGKPFAQFVSHNRDRFLQERSQQKRR